MIVKAPSESWPIVAAALLAAASLGEAQTAKPQHTAPTCSGGFRRAAEPAARRTRRKEDVNRRNDDGSTPLQWAVYKATSPR